jgi:MoxR-like ATPase
VFERNHAGTSADCHVFFPDETFRGSSAALNALLTLINEHSFGGKPVPMRSAIGATNMLPSDDGLDAIDDRFLLRLFVGDLAKDDSFAALLSGAADPSRRKYVPNPAHTFTVEEWDQATADASKVTLPASVIALMLTLDKRLKDAQIRISPRRWASLVRVVQAVAWLDGCAAVEPDHLEILRHGLWRKVEERTQVNALINALDAGDVKWISDQTDSVLRAIADWNKLPPQDKADQCGRISGVKVTVTDAIVAKFPGFNKRARERARVKVAEVEQAFLAVKAEGKRLMGF